MPATDFMLDGVYVAVVTPFAEDGSLDTGAWGRLVDYLADGGVAGLVVAGTTGEYYALSESERHEVFELARDAAAGRVQLIAGCNAGSTREVLRHAAAAQALGYEALMLPVPHTSLPTQAELHDHFATVARETGMPVVLYNFPARAGVAIEVDTLVALAEIDEIVAVKEASGDFSRFLELTRRLDDRMAISCGSDDQAYDYFGWGVRSWIAGTANVLPREHVELLAGVRAGEAETARSLHAALLPWIQAMESGSYNQKAKLGLALQGVDVGDVRAPLRPLDAVEAEAYADVLRAARQDAAGVLERAASAR